LNVQELPVVDEHIHLELPLLASKLSWSCHIDKTVAKAGRNHAAC